ncbi:NACHT domain-containing protein [Streptomyces sp. NPDC049813]|uniref:NACHT domain-containing protein n=1 Tax=Streptomyces sp. NPDC049813 TaxID=3365597 RepID=UPI0037AAE95D
MLRSASERTVAVLSGAQGSGVMLSPRLVLTSAHVLCKKEWIRAAHPSGEQPIPSRVVWTDAALDAALLLTGEDLVAPDTWALPRLRWGTVATTAALPSCQIVGFPAVQRYQDGRLESDQFTGVVLPLAGEQRGALVCELDRPPVEPVSPASASSPLAGLSGSPVFAGAVLIGIVTEVPRGRGHRRIEAVPVASILAAADFPRFVAGADPGYLPPILEPVTETHPDDERFERHYARALQARYRKTEIFGIDELGTTENKWDLDTAYLSLEALTSDRGAGAVAPVRHRIDDLLVDRPRTLLRGEAGAGKTTLVWWLASHAACGALRPELAALNDLVPFVVPMRSLSTLGTAFPGPGELPNVAELPVDGIPPGWARRVLEAGRGLLLVDGIDEVPPRDRDDARRKLSELLAMYPHNRCLVTVRPLAVEESWLSREGFDELRLLPMQDEDILAFSRAWHAAARIECDGFRDAHRATSELHALTALEQALEQELLRNRTLLNLTRTPLLCAVVCALHRRRRGLLPTSRWSLYTAALSMLLGGRDAQRRVNAPEGINLGVEENKQLLQRIAAWLARGGAVEFTHDQARHQIELAMAGMPQVQQQGTPDAVLTHLLNRSGLLQERNEKIIQFIHRTFQDYLAAKELQECDSLAELLRHAGDEQWQDIVLLAVGHCNRGEVRRLVNDLIAKGDEQSTRGARADIHVLAAHCAMSAIYLDERERATVAARIRALLPPADATESARLASLGAYILPLMPEAATVADASVAALVTLIRNVGGLAALPLLRDFAGHEDPVVRRLLRSSWAAFPAEAYAREVLSAMRLDDDELTVTATPMITALRHCGPVGHVTVDMPISSADLAAALPPDRFTSLTVSANPLLGDLAFVRDQSALRSLALRDCPRVSQLSALARLPLRTLRLEIGHLRKSELSVVEELTELRDLTVVGAPLDSRIPLPRGHARVEKLRVSSDDETMINDLTQWPALDELVVEGDCDVLSLLLAAAKAPALTSLDFVLPRLVLPLVLPRPLLERRGRQSSALAKARQTVTPKPRRLAPLPRIRSLTLRGVSRGGTAAEFARVFPSLTHLTLHTIGGVRLDLSALDGHQGLVTTINETPV